MDGVVFCSFLLWYGTPVCEYTTMYLSFSAVDRHLGCFQVFCLFFFFLTISNDIVMYIFNHICVKVSPGKYLRVKLLAWELNDDLVFSKGS